MATPPFFNDLTQNCRRQKLNEKDLLRICRNIGSNWELIAAELGIKKTDREKAMIYGKSPDLVMVDVFMKWTQREPRLATMENLVKAMWACNSTCTIDWDELELVFKDMH